MVTVEGSHGCVAVLATERKRGLFEVGFLMLLGFFFGYFAMV